MPETTNVCWDLSDLYNSIDDPAINESLASVLNRAKQFAEKYRGQIDNQSLNAETLFEAIKEYEDIVQELVKPISYAGLVFAADTSKPEHGAFLQYMQEKQTEVSVELMFFELELMAASPEIIDSILDNPLMEKYKHFVHASRLFRDHRLSEAEERILEEKANTGGRAFERLFEETISAIEFEIEIDGEKKILSEPEILALLRDARRDVRKAAAESLTKGLTSNSRLITFIFNIIVLDKAIDDRLRSYEYPEQARNISNELDAETVETVVSTCTDNYDLVARYYKTKKEILGYDVLTHYDRYAPLFEAKKEYSFEQARDIVLSSFGNFSSEMETSARAFFDNGWIDAEPRKGKRGGAFCSYVTPDIHPYVFLSYLNKKDDIMTLGHEMGHAVHAYLSRPQGYLNYSSSLPVAELASTFGEMLVFENLVRESDLQDKLALYAEKIEEAFATIFRQAAMYRFEQELHRQRRVLGELTTEEICDIWQRNIQDMFLDSVKLGDDHKNWWMYVNHFIGSPFYVYAYSFGELLVFALYSMYKKEGEPFVPKYIELLKTGGACSPEELLARVGINVRDKDFWQGGMAVVEKLVADFEALYSQWKSSK